MQIRNQLNASLARQFPEIDRWLVGSEPNWEFYDCSGQRLTLQDQVTFIADSLQGIKAAIQGVNPQATVISHFLGRRDIPLLVREGLVQPRAMVARILDEIGRRGHTTKTYFDELAVNLDPELGLDRQMQAGSTPVFGLSSADETPGWNIKYLEEFRTATSDLVATYADWENWRTDTRKTELTATQVTVPPGTNDGKALMRLVTPTPPPTPAEGTSLGGAITAVHIDGVQGTGPDIVPEDEFKTALPERNQWVAVMDFFPVTPTNPPAAHTPVFLRVNDRTWIDPARPEDGFTPNQTRFGSFVTGGQTEPQLVPCTGMSGPPAKSWGALQVTGNDRNPPAPYQVGEVGKTSVFCFELREADGGLEDPFAHPSRLYRVQIIEKELFSTLDGWKLRWRAEVLDISNPQNIRFVGGSNWFSEDTIRTFYGIDVPELIAPDGKESKLGIGLGPGIAGGLDAERAGTSYWVY